MRKQGRNKMLKSVFLHRREVIVITTSLLIFIIALLFSSRLITFWNTTSIKKEGIQIETKIQQELNDISKQREEIIASRVFNHSIKNNDLPQLRALIQTEVKKRNLDFIVITDKDGFVLARSGLTAEQGDNVFQTTIQGRSVALGETVTTIVRDARNPLALISDSYIFEQNKPIGSILVGHRINNEYADRFQEKYLKRDGVVAFHASQEGIVGDSFKNKDKTQLINAYFSLGSDLVAQNLAGLSKEIKIGASFYTIHHIVFPGISNEEAPGGAFVFFPIHHNSYSLFLAGCITLFFFVFYYSIFFLLKLLGHHEHQKPFFLLVGLALFIAIDFLTITKLDRSAIELKKSPYIIYNSVMKFVPESDVISELSEKTIAIKVFTGGEAINVVRAVIEYDPSKLRVLDILTVNSLCDQAGFLDKTIDNNAGLIKITCVPPNINPGFYEPEGTVAELVILPLAQGEASLRFVGRTQVLANDGLQTDVLRSTTDAYYQVVRQKFATADIQNPIPIFSSSHPNSNRWYKNKNIELSWPELSGGTYYYTISHTLIPSAEDKILSTTNNYLSTSIAEGINYFHLQAKDQTGKSGLVSSFRIMVDSTAPLAPKIRASSKTIQKGDIVRLDFTSKDSVSGLQSGFYVKINAGILLPVKPPFYIPFLKSGDYPIVVRVFDKANNFSDSSIVIHVSN